MSPRGVAGTRSMRSLVAPSRRVMALHHVLLFVFFSSSFIALPSAQATGDYDGDITLDLASMCTQSGNTILLRMDNNRRTFSTWINELLSFPRGERLSHYFHSKPVDSEFCKCAAYERHLIRCI